MDRNPGFGQRAKLVELATAGYFTLPDEIIDAHRVAARLDAERRRPVTDVVGPARQRLAEDFRTAAADEAPWPDGAELAEALTAQRANVERLPILERVTAEAQADFVDAVVESTTRIITKHLRPVLDEILTEATKAAEAMAPYGDSPAALLTAPAPARKAYGALDGLAERYGVLRDAKAILNRGVERLDDADVFGELRNLADVWPNWRKRGEPPWPTTSAAVRLLWLVRSEAEPWMPTAGEQDDRYREVFAEGLANMAHAQAVRGAVHAWAGSRA